MTEIKYTKNVLELQNKNLYYLVEFNPCCEYMKHLEATTNNIKIIEYNNLLCLTMNDTTINFCNECGAKTQFIEITDKLKYIKDKMEPRYPGEHLTENNKWEKDYEGLGSYTERILLEILRDKVERYPSRHTNLNDDLTDYLNAIIRVSTNIKTCMDKLK